MRTITFAVIKFAIAIAVTLTFVSVLAGVYNHRPPSQIER